VPTAVAQLIVIGSLMLSWFGTGAVDSANQTRTRQAILAHAFRLWFAATVEGEGDSRYFNTGWASDPLMVGIRSPDGLVVGSCTSQPGVLCSIPKEGNQGKQGATLC
jgi:hypothetical protein